MLGIFVVLLFKAGLLCVVQAVLEVTLYARLCTSATIIGMYYH